MLGRFMDNEVTLSFRPQGEVFLKVKNFLFTKIPVEPKESARVYFLEMDSDEMLSEMSLSWKNNKREVLELLAQNSIQTGIFFKTFYAEGILSGSFVISSKKISIAASKLKIRSSRENVMSVFGEKLKLKDLDEPQPKKHSCD